LIFPSARIGAAADVRAITGLRAVGFRRFFDFGRCDRADWGAINAP
jgi:hypothetical protein